MTEELRQKLLHSAEGPGAEPFNQYNHMKVTAVDDGTATVELELHPDSLNCWGTPHGGALFTMADVAAGMALLTLRQEVTFTVSSSIEYLSAAPGTGKLTDTIFFAKSAGTAARAPGTANAHAPKTAINGNIERIKCCLKIPLM